MSKYYRNGVSAKLHKGTIDSKILNKVYLVSKMCDFSFFILDKNLL